MFNPNLSCQVRRSSGKNDVYGQPLPGIVINEKCSIVKLSLTNEKSAVRADTSASRGNALELEAISVILMTPKSQARIDDLIYVSGVVLRVMGRIPRYDVSGVINHYEIHATFWSNG